eukprot:XP_001699613.1 predicted protein [Chlamydomonas reinhardtii]
MLLLIAVALLTMGLQQVTAQSCSGSTWTGGGSPMYDCSSNMTAYVSSNITTPSSAIGGSAGGLAGPPYWGTSSKCLSGEPTVLAEQLTSWFTGNNGATSCNITVYFDTYAAVGILIVHKGAAKSNISPNLTLLPVWGSPVTTSCGSEPAAKCGTSDNVFWYTCSFSGTLTYVAGITFGVQDNGYKVFDAVVDVPDDLATSPEALAALFPGGASLAVTGKNIRVPVEITTAVQATAVLTTSLGISTQVEVGCNSAFLDAFRSELALRANLTTDIISNVSCNAGAPQQAASRHHRRRLYSSDSQGGIAGGGEPYSDAWDGGEQKDEAGLELDDGYGGDGDGAGAGSLSLLVVLSVPAAATNNSQLYKSQIAAALDAWTAESAAGSGAPGMLQLCGPSMDDIVTTTTVRVVSEVALSSMGASNLSSVCGSADLTTTTALGGAGSSVACRVTAASTGDDGRPPAVSNPSPAPASAPVSAAGATTSYLSIIIAAAVTGGVVGAVCLAVIGIVARRRSREKRQREAGDPGELSSSELDHGVRNAASRTRDGRSSSARPVAGTAGATAAGASGGGNAFGRRTADMSAAEESEIRSAFQHALQSAGPPPLPRSDDWSVHGRHADPTSSALVPLAVSAPPAGGAAAWSGPNGPMSADQATIGTWGGSSGGPGTGSGYVGGGAAAAGAPAMRASFDRRASSPGISGRSVRVSRRVQPLGNSNQVPLQSRGASPAVSGAHISSGGLPPVELSGPQEPQAFRSFASMSGATGAAAAASAPVAGSFRRQSLVMNPAFESDWEPRASPAAGAAAGTSAHGGARPMSGSVIVARATAGGGAAADGASRVAGSPTGSEAISLFERFKSQLTGGLNSASGRPASIDGSPGGSPRAGNRGLSLRNITAMFKEGGGSGAGTSVRPSLDGLPVANGGGAAAGMAAGGALGLPLREDVPDIEGAPPLETRGSGASIPEGSPEHSPSTGADDAIADGGAAVTGVPPPPPRAPNSAAPAGAGAPVPVLGSPLAPPSAFALGARPSRLLRKAKTQTASPSLHGDELGAFDDDEPGAGLQQRQRPGAAASALSAISPANVRAGAAAGQRSTDTGMLSSAAGASAAAAAAAAPSPGIRSSVRRAMFPTGSKSASVLGGRRATHSGVPDDVAVPGARSAKPPSLLSPDASASRAPAPAAAKQPLREAFAPVPDAGPPGSLNA